MLVGIAALNAFTERRANLSCSIALAGMADGLHVKCNSILDTRGLSASHTKSTRESSLSRKQTVTTSIVSDTWTDGTCKGAAAGHRNMSAGKACNLRHQETRNRPAFELAFPTSLLPG